MTEDPYTPKRRRRILAVSSGGGHWLELLRLRPAFEGHDVAYVTVRPSYRTHLTDERFYVVNDATRWNKFGLMLCALRLLWVLIRERPDVVISTGAAPGYLALALGRMMGARTCWLDSIPNSEKLTRSGEAVRRWATLWLTQWPHLATPDGPRYEGSVL